MTTTVNAPALMNSQGAMQLMEDFKKSDGQDLQLDASDVKHVGAQALQVMLVARKHWADGAKSLEIINPSTDFRQGLQALGAEDLLHNVEQPS